MNLDHGVPIRSRDRTFRSAN